MSYKPARRLVKRPPQPTRRIDDPLRLIAIDVLCGWADDPWTEGLGANHRRDPLAGPDYEWWCDTADIDPRLFREHYPRHGRSDPFRTA